MKYSIELLRQAGAVVDARRKQALKLFEENKKSIKHIVDEIVKKRGIEIVC